MGLICRYAGTGTRTEGVLFPAVALRGSHAFLRSVSSRGNPHGAAFGVSEKHSSRGHHPT